MILRATWRGDLPARGDYLASARPRAAYRIDRVVERTLAPIEVAYEPTKNAVLEVRTLRLHVERVPLRMVPPSARVHPWRWAPRGPRRGRGVTRPA